MQIRNPKSVQAALVLCVAYVCGCDTTESQPPADTSNAPTANGPSDVAPAETPAITKTPPSTETPSPEVKDSGAPPLVPPVSETDADKDKKEERQPVSNSPAGGETAK